MIASAAIGGASTEVLRDLLKSASVPSPLVGLNRTTAEVDLHAARCPQTPAEGHIIVVSARRVLAVR